MEPHGDSLMMQPMYPAHGHGGLALDRAAADGGLSETEELDVETGSDTDLEGSIGLGAAHL
jgi:hypothetical protein